MSKQIPNTPLFYDTAKVSYPKSLFSGRRKVVGIRIDENLYSAFKPIAKRVFGSVCRPIESFMASVVALDNVGANFGNTIKVHEIKIERNLRARRRLVVEEEITLKEEVSQSEKKCFGCKKWFTGLPKVLFVSGKKGFVCPKCKADYEERRLIRKVLGAT